MHLYYSDDFFKTEKLALEAGNSIVRTYNTISPDEERVAENLNFANDFMYIAKAVSKDNVKVYVSDSANGFLNFR